MTIEFTNYSLFIVYFFWTETFFSVVVENILFYFILFYFFVFNLFVFIKTIIIIILWNGITDIDKRLQAYMQYVTLKKTLESIMIEFKERNLGAKLDEKELESMMASAE